MSYMPSMRELNELYYKRGDSAVNWYAWRNVLRALTSLGATPLHQIWSEDCAKHVSAVLRIPFIYASYPLTFNRREILTDALYDYGMAHSCAKKNFYLDECSSYFTKSGNRVKFTALDVIDHAIVELTDLISSPPSENNKKINRYPYIEAARVDYNFVFKKSNFKWHFTDIWPKKSFGFISTKPDYIQHRESYLLNELHLLGLKVWSEDLKRLWSGDINGFCFDEYFYFQSDFSLGFGQDDPLFAEKPKKDDLSESDQVALEEVTADTLQASNLNNTTVTITGSGNQVVLGNGNTQKQGSDNVSGVFTPIANQSSNITHDSIKAERKQRLLEKLSALYNQHDLETRVEEKMRLKALIDQTNFELNNL